MLRRSASFVLLGLASLAVAGCRSSSPTPRREVAGALVKARLPNGFKEVGRDDAIAQEVITAGGFFVRQADKTPAATIGVMPLSNLAIDPTDRRVCVAGAAKEPGLRVEAREVRGRFICTREFSKAGTNIEVRSFHWLLNPATSLGVMLVCEHEPSDEAAAEACLSVVGSVVPINGS